MAALTVGFLFGAWAGGLPPVEKSSFRRPPAIALKSLKATVGKPFSSGYVFIDGKYLEPPYKVERYGTAIRINGRQVTGEVIPWSAFAKTQPGVRRNVEVLAADPAAEAMPEAAPAPEPVSTNADDDELALDELFAEFDDAPKTAKRHVAKPRPKAPRSVVTYELTAPFELNASASELLAKINARRTQIDRDLRCGGYYCFSARYGDIRGDAKLAKSLVDRLPDIMKRCNTTSAFAGAMRNAGFSYLPHGLIGDLFKNRLDYIPLDNRRKADAERRQWQALMNE